VHPSGRANARYSSSSNSFQCLLLAVANPNKPLRRLHSDNVLCEDCERLFAKNGENYALRVAADRRGFRLLDELTQCGLTRGRLGDSRWSEISSSPEVKRDDLAYFALSVSWRAAIHRWPDPEDPTRTIKIELGPSNTELLRRFLLGETALPPTVNLTFYVLTDRLSQATIYLPGRTSKIGSRWGYGFVACGFMSNLFLGKKADPAASRERIPFDEMSN
jgi:hypothetical protein